MGSRRGIGVVYFWLEMYLGVSYLRPKNTDLLATSTIKLDFILFNYEQNISRR